MITDLHHVKLSAEASHFDKVWERVPLRRIDDKMTIPGLKTLEGLKVLICSCGAGLEPVRAARAGADVYAVDISPVGVRKALEMAEFNGFDIHGAVMDLHHLEFPSDFFDVIYGSAILHHLDCTRAGQEFYRCLKANGIAYFFEENSDRNPILRFFYHALSKVDGNGGFKKILFFKRIGTPGERMLSSKDITTLSQQFSGNISIVIDKFMFFQKLSHVTGGRFSKTARVLDEISVKLFPALKQYSYEQNVFLRKGLPIS